MKTLLLVLTLVPLTTLAGQWRYSDTAMQDSVGNTLEQTSEADEQPGSIQVSSNQDNGDTGMETSSTNNAPLPENAPVNNMTMREVIDSIGLPADIVDAVGEPPITRWKYPSYTVYFEGDRVIVSLGASNEAE